MKGGAFSATSSGERQKIGSKRRLLANTFATFK
jgi:hypothetical protein